jgi:anti-anti-sigma factor
VSEPQRAAFEIEASSAEGGITVVTVRGELDFDEAPALERTLADLRAGGEREIVVDLGELMFIDSSGISVLVAAARAVSADRGMLVVASPTPHVQRVFEIVRLAELMAIEDTREGALQRIGWRREQSAG